MSKKVPGAVPRKSIALCGLAALVSLVLVTVVACEDLDSDTNVIVDASATTTIPAVEATEVPATETNGSESSSTSEFLPELEAEAALGPTSTVWVWTRFESEDSRLRYSGVEWSGSMNSAASGGSYWTAGNPGAAVEMEFLGTRIALVSFTGTDMGRAKLTLDGGSSIYIDLYDPVGKSETVWTSGTLGANVHTLRIEWTGAKGPSATDAFISIDAVDVLGTLLGSTEGGLDPSGGS